MPKEPDFQVDTDWIRRAADTIQQTGSALSACSRHGPAASVHSASLGPAATAAEVAELIMLRDRQAQDAAAQLAVIATTLGENLSTAAERFERQEAAMTIGTR
jgi:hypothetical protein